MRLDRFIAHATGYSRKQVQALIKAGEVSVSDQNKITAQTSVGTDQIVTLNGVELKIPAPVYLMLNKPTGYICATEDSQNPVVLDLLPESGRTFHPKQPIQIVGRLDIDTTGLLLLTTDGQWNHHVTAPNSRCKKIYRVTLSNPLTPPEKQSLEQGLVLRGEGKATLPCQIDTITSHIVDIHLQEGKYHQVKRMFAAVGNHVENLHRYQIGDITLDASLKPGEFRHLVDEEIQSVNA